MPHDRLFLDALERDLKREKMGLEPTTAVIGEPASSFTYDPKRTLYEQFSKAQGAQEGEGELETAVRRAEEAMAADERERSHTVGGSGDVSQGTGPGTPFFKMFSLFEGSPSYKQRRKKGPRGVRSGLARDAATSEDEVPDRSSSHAADAIDDADGEMTAAMMFDAQASLASGTNAQVQAQKQAETQRLVQAQHLAMLNRRAPGVLEGHGQQRRQTAQVPTSSSQASSLMAASYRANAPGRNTYPLMPEASMAPTTGVVRKTKAYVCPLYSCQRLFKRLEHLKRHVRMHTMERPFLCELCQRRFSRADNLAQHVRTHARDGESGVSAAAIANASPNANGGSDAELEAEGVEQSMYTPGETFDLGTCEVEVTDNAQMHFEDDDGTSGANGMFTNGGFPTSYGMDGTAAAQQQFPGVLSTSPENSPRLRANEHWAMGGYNDYAAPQQQQGSTSTSAHPSPAFSHTSTGTPSRYTTSYGGGPGAGAGAYRMQSEYSPNGAGANGMFSAPTSAGSMSAPAHKLTFDHGAMYPASLAAASFGAVPGPSGQGPSHASSSQGQNQASRRFRSATPTIARAGEHIRRPSTANTLDGNGQPTRGYHPYAQYANGHAVTTSHSAHSSPAPYSLSLDAAASYGGSLDAATAGLDLGGVHANNASAAHSTTHSPAGSVAGSASFQDDLGALMGLSSDSTMSSMGVGSYEASAAAGASVPTQGYMDPTAAAGGYYALEQQSAVGPGYAYDLGAGAS